MGNTKEFDNIFNECLEHLLTGQETIEQCVQRYPAYAAELEPLLRTAVLMHKVTDVKPSDELRARARYQMQLKMAQTPAPAKRPTRVVPRWAIATCTAMLVFVLSGGAVLAAQNVMPGNPLYAVKLTTENLQVRLAGSTDSKTEQYIAMANARISEMAWMVNNNKTPNLQAAAQRLNNYYTSIGELAMTGGAKTTFSSAAIPAGPSATTMVATTATQTAETLITQPVTTVINTTPVITSPPVVLGPVNSNNIAAAGSNGSVSNSNRASQLLNTLSSNAAVQPLEIQQLLNSDKVPAGVKTLLRTALAQSNVAYQSAISNANHP